MPKSTYYYEISKVDTVDFRNIKLTEEIKKIFSQHKGRYGVRRVYRELLRRGNSVNHKRVQRIMHSLGLQGKRPKEKYHSFYYNNERIQGKTKWMPPVMYRIASMCST